MDSLMEFEPQVTLMGRVVKEQEDKHCDDQGRVTSVIRSMTVRRSDNGAEYLVRLVDMVPVHER